MDAASDMSLQESCKDAARHLSAEVHLLADKANRLEQENAKLRSMRDTWQENDAKLRELCRRLMNHIEHPPCDGCSFECDGTDLTRCDEWSFMEANARELGIEVSE